MKQLKIIILLLVSLVLSANRCNKDCHKKITFVNNSSKEVYIEIDFNYPDTLGFRYMFPSPYNEPDIYGVKPGKKNSSALWDWDCLEKEMEHGFVVIYVFDAEVLANYSWGEIGRDYMVLKTIHPSLEEMEQNDWTIIFTGE